MTFVTTTCSACGEIEVPLGRVLLRVSEPAGSAACVVRCPSCGERLVKEADLAMSSLMMTLGVEVSRWGSLLSRGAPSDLGMITAEELDAFCARMADDAALVRHLESTL